MTISELIKSLQELQQEHGDLPVYLLNEYTLAEGWGNMKVWNTDGVKAGFRQRPITLDGSGDEHTFIGLR